MTYPSFYWEFLEDDFECITAELVYDITLCLPGEFVSQALDPHQDNPTDYVTRLKSAMQQLPVTTVCRHPQRAMFINKAPETCSHLLVRLDAVKQPLQQPYDVNITSCIGQISATLLISVASRIQSSWII